MSTCGSYEQKKKEPTIPVLAHLFPVILACSPLRPCCLVECRLSSEKGLPFSTARLGQRGERGDESHIYTQSVEEALIFPFSLIR